MVLGAVCAVGCGSSGSTTGGDSSAKAASTGDAKAGGGFSGYVDAYCACKGDTKCIADAGMKFKDAMGDAGKDVSLAKKLADCTTANPPKM